MLNHIAWKPTLCSLVCFIIMMLISNQTSAQSIKYDEVTSNSDYPYIWSNPDSPYLTELRNKYNLEEKVADCKNDYEKAKVIVSWVNSLWEHHGANSPQKSDPISIIEEVKKGKRFRCVEYGIVVSGALNALGIPSRVVGLKNKHVETELLGAGHVVADAYIKDLGKWIMIDGQWGVVPTLNGTPLNAVELQQALAEQNPIPGLDVYSDSEVDKERYFNWIEEYLYYIDVPFDNRNGIEQTEYVSGSLMLVPEGAIRPEKFQVKWNIGGMFYTHSIYDLYPELTTDIYKDVEIKKVEIKKLFNQRIVAHQSDYMIGEIIIAGLNRTNEDVVKRQLPYKIGDRWTNELQKLTEQRLAQLNIFNPLTVKVRAEKIKEKKVRIIISTEDVNPFMVHPVKIRGINYATKAAIFKSKDLYEKQLTYRVINPLGSGLSISAGVNWSSDPWWKVGLDYAGAKGKVYSLAHKDYTSNDERFNNIDFKTGGFKTRFSVDYIPVADWKLILALGWQKNDYIVSPDNTEQEYLTVGTEVKWNKYDELNLKVNYGRSLIKEEPDFKQLELSWDKSLRVKNDKLVTNLSGGISSQETPLNYQFKGGGNSKIPLRGHEFNLAGNRYFSGNVEYHKLIIDDWVIGLVDLWGIAFLDYAKIIPVHSVFSDVPWEVDGGIGLACDTPLGLMRIDVGLDNFKENPIYNITFTNNI